MTDDPYAPPEWYDPQTLVQRLSGIYAIPINDGLGPLDGEEIINGHPHFVREFPGRPEIQGRAANLILRLESGEMTDSHEVLDLIEELKEPADPLNIGQKSIVPIHREAMARLKELMS
jgi:hypothetical protein